MSKWVIDKQFSFCYGHRVYTQTLEKEFCERNDYQCKCKHPHGHEGLVHVFLEGEELTRGMVTDFKHLGWLKNFLDDVIDHKFIIGSEDPIFKHLITNVWKANTTEELSFKSVTVQGTNHVTGYSIDNLELVDNLSDQELLEGYFIVDFVPTSENLCKWLFDIVTAKMKKLDIKVSRIDWFETPKSRSSYLL